MADTSQTPGQAAGISGTTVPVSNLADAASPNEAFDVSTKRRPETGAFPEPATGAATGSEATPASDGVANKARPVAPAPDANEGIILSDGRRATFRALKGRDAMKAHERAQGDGEKTNYVLAAMATKIEGKQVILEDLEELPLADFFAVINGYGEKNGQ